jgi:hypothetical protein
MESKSRQKTEPAPPLQKSAPAQDERFDIMLTKTEVVYHDREAPRHSDDRRHIRLRSRICGRTLAQRKHEPGDRENLAALWCLGSLIIRRPTVVSAAKVFVVSTALIKKSIDNLQATTTASTQPEIELIWAELDDDERLKFIRNNISEIWGLIDRATFPVAICPKRKK